MDAIAAISLNRVIGNKGVLPWKIKEDLKFFQEFTMCKTLIFGHNTYKELPLLKLRNLIVLTRGKNPPSLMGPNAATTIFTKDINSIPENSVICGGAQIYELLLPKCETLYLTTIKKEYEGDTFFPKFEHLFNFSELLYSDDLIDIQKYIRN